MDLPTPGHTTAASDPQAHLATPPEVQPVGALDVARYLIGDRRAILKLAGSPHAVLAALILVFSAALAREYDGVDLTVGPQVLLAPLAASAALATWLYAVLWAVFLRKAAEPVVRNSYWKLLTLYWMTAPLAWLYAIPYERWMTPYDATVANLLTLGVVSFWRVALITRAISVMCGAGFLAVLGPVLFFADVIAVPAAFIKNFSVVDVMGGIRLTEAEALVRHISAIICVDGFFTCPLWLLWAILASGSYRTNRATPEAPGGRVHPSLWVLAVLSLVVWIPVLPYTQAEQRLNTRFDQMLEREEYGGAWQLLAEHELTDFPPHWRVKSTRVIVLIFEAELRQPNPTRARPFLLLCLEEKIKRDGYYHDDWMKLMTELLPRLEEGPRLAADVIAGFEDKEGFDVLLQRTETAGYVKALKDLADRAPNR